MAPLPEWRRSSASKEGQGPVISMQKHTLACSPAASAQVALASWTQLGTVQAQRGPLLSSGGTQPPPSDSFPPQSAHTFLLSEFAGRCRTLACPARAMAPSVQRTRAARCLVAPPPSGSDPPSHATQRGVGRRTGRAPPGRLRRAGPQSGRPPEDLEVGLGVAAWRPGGGWALGPAKPRGTPAGTRGGHWISTASRLTCIVGVPPPSGASPSDEELSGRQPKRP